MIKTNLLCVLFGVWATFNVVAQTKDIVGEIVASGDKGGIHIINKTANKFTITNDEGIFEIPARLFDTIMVSSVQYHVTEFVVTDIIMQTKKTTVYLEDKINALDEVVIGKVLTGNLMSDIENAEVKRSINFYDVGIPGYTGPRMSQSERRVYEAQSGSGLIPLNPLINWISGRTKRLKAQVKREKVSRAADEAMARFSTLLFVEDDMDATKCQEFFYFCADDPEFLRISKTRNDMLMLQFLKEKLTFFKVQIETD